ncbi:MAG: murein L,D-transpeptidase catalytic domain family protein, partial [Gammaproteobacteria bacterium]
KKRLWVLDLQKHKVLYNTYVAHGQKSGDVYASHFSNQFGTHASSIGLFLTQNSYFGSKGLSLRLNGLDKGYNDNALRRAIVIHGAWYVDSKFANRYGRIGRSWGCPSVTPALAKPIINTIKDGSLVFAYAPNFSWLHHSKYLTRYA